MTMTKDAPFKHQDRCKHPTAAPEWYDVGDGQQERVCSCGTERRMDPKRTAKLDPRTQSPKPSVAAHHQNSGWGCDVGTLPPEMQALAVRIDRYPDGGWRSHCSVCTSTLLYWWMPDHWERGFDGEMYRTKRSGIVLYEYETEAAASA